MGEVIYCEKGDFIVDLLVFVNKNLGRGSRGVLFFMGVFCFLWIGR